MEGRWWASYTEVSGNIWGPTWKSNLPSDLIVCGGGTVSEIFPPRDLLENLGKVEDNQLARAERGSESGETGYILKR